MITVCMPAYRAEAFIADSARSVLAQTASDLRLVVAVDPPEDGRPDLTPAALEPFRDDPRVEIRLNPRRLGWAGNFDALIRSVETERFALLPHDDLWAPTYVETLGKLLDAMPGASVAYADLERFGDGAQQGTRRSVRLPQGEARSTHLLRFFLEGAHAMPWRGLTRTAALGKRRGFPTDRWRGFAVECEYALGLLEAGAVLHHPEAIYRKRVFGAGRRSASKERAELVAEPARVAAWERHRREMTTRLHRMLAALAAPAPVATLCATAADAALLRRGMTMAGRLPTAAEIARCRRAADICRGLGHPLGEATARFAEALARDASARARSLATPARSSDGTAAARG